MDGQFDYRKYPRVRNDALISVTRVDSDPVLAEAVDSSLGGIRFASLGLHPEPGEMLRVRLYPGGREVRVLGKVVPVQELDALSQEIGLAFLDVETGPWSCCASTSRTPKSCSDPGGGREGPAAAPHVARPARPCRLTERNTRPSVIPAASCAQPAGCTVVEVFAGEPLTEQEKARVELWKQKAQIERERADILAMYEECLTAP